MAHKPVELRELPATTRKLFAILKAHFDVGDTFTFSLKDVDAPDALQDFTKVAAFSLRKIQALHYAAQPKTGAASDVIIELVAALSRSLPELASQVGDLEIQKEILMLREKIIRAGVAVGEVPPDEDSSEQLVHFQ